MSRSGEVGEKLVRERHVVSKRDLVERETSLREREVVSSVREVVSRGCFERLFREIGSRGRFKRLFREVVPREMRGRLERVVSRKGRGETCIRARERASTVSAW